MATTGTARASKLKNISVDTTSKTPLYVQLHAAICRAIEEGTLAVEAKLPAIGEMATLLSVSRNTVRRALQKLEAEQLIKSDGSGGYLVAPSASGPLSAPVVSITSADTSASKPQQAKLASAKSAANTASHSSVLPFSPAKSVTTTGGAAAAPAREQAQVPANTGEPRSGSAFFKALKSPVASQEPAVITPSEIMPATTTAPEISKEPVSDLFANADVIAVEARTTVTFSRSAVLDQIDLSRLHASGGLRPFRPGFPETTEFPLGVWEELRARLLRQKASELLDFTGTFGYMPLREAIAARLRNARGVKCSAEQVIITSGALPSLNLIIDTLASPGDIVGMEEPGYYGAKAAFLRAGAKVAPLLVDEEGLIVPDAKRKNPPSLVYATPTNQFPLGAALTLPRRLALLDYAHQTNAWIIEDDSDGDFCYSGHPTPSLQGADQQQRVLYFGTTGRSLFPSLEIGYLVVPLSLMESFNKTKEISGGQPSVIDQATLACFMSEGHFDKHLRRMNLIYYQRLQTLSDSVQSELSGYIQLDSTQAGLHAVGWLARGIEEDFVSNAANSAGIELPLLSRYGRTALVRPGVVFGFASFSEKKIRQTVRSLGRALRSSNTQKALPPAPNMHRSGLSGFFRRWLPGRRD